MRRLFTSPPKNPKKTELSCSGLSETALEHRIRQAVQGHRWVCDRCGTVEFVEREVSCWSCHDGEMVYKRMPPLVEVQLTYDELITIKNRSDYWTGELNDLQKVMQTLSAKALKTLAKLI